MFTKLTDNLARFLRPRSGFTKPAGAGGDTQVTIRARQSGGDTADSATYPVTIPGDAGDFVVMLLHASFSADPATFTLTPPAGFTEVVPPSVITGFFQKVWLIKGNKSAASDNAVFSTAAIQFAYVSIAVFSDSGTPAVFLAGLAELLSTAGTTWDIPAATGNDANKDVEICIGGRVTSLSGGTAANITGYVRTLVSQDTAAPRMFTCLWDRQSPGTVNLPAQSPSGSQGGREYCYHFAISAS